MYKSSVKSWAVAILTLTATSLSAAAPVNAAGYLANYDVYVISVQSWDTLNMRKWPASYSQKVAQIPHDGEWIWVQRCIIKQYGADWCKVNYNGNWGWVNSRFITQH